MENVVLTPAAGQSIVATHDHNQHHNHNRHDSIEARADFRSLTNEVERFGTANLASACATDRLVQSGFAATSDRICDSTGKVIAEIDRHGDAAALAACKTDDAVAESKLFNAVQFKDQVIEANKNSSNLSTLVSTVGNAAQVLATAFAGQARDQATMYASAQTVQTERVRAELALAQQMGFAAAQLEAARNKADSDAKLAKCCCDAELQAAQNFAALQAQADRNTCDLKQLVTAEGEKSRALANDIEARRMQERIRFLETQTLVLTGGVFPSGARQAA